MTNAGIEAFLIVCKQHSISKAAAELFISQSSLSIRLRTLEKEVGCPLFFRHKGSREMVLTEEGKRFYQLSLQYQDIVRSMLAIGNRKSSLRLSALNSVSTYLLPPVYEQFMRDHPDIHLEIQDMTVEAACQSLLRGETDLAFTSDAPRTDAIRAELVMTEPMDLICAAGSCYSDGIGPDELPVRQEVYVGWTDEFARWHQELWGVDAVPRIQLEIMSQLQMFMTKRDSWAVVPRSVADGLCAAGGRRLAAAFPLPERRIHALQKKAVSWRLRSCFWASPAGCGPQRRHEREAAPTGLRERKPKKDSGERNSRSDSTREICGKYREGSVFADPSLLLLRRFKERCSFSARKSRTYRHAPASAAAPFCRCRRRSPSDCRRCPPRGGRG